MLELLAPAGNLQCANVAIDNGANAIYLGYSSFSARQSAENFDENALLDVVKKARFCGVKVYVAMNTLVKDNELEGFIKALLSVWSCGVDAIIMQDLLLGKEIKSRYPQIVLHASTQAGICNENGAIFAKECGFSRVILARETPLAEISKITKIIETEAFVQGALCTCFSGQCYFSSFAGGNSGNRGRCKQPCRKLYAYNRNDNAEKNYALSLSDLCVGEDIRKYIDAGVTSFKIEGRLRRAEYVGAAVRYYRGILDNGAEDKKNLSDLKRTFNRGNYTKGLAFGQDKRFLSTAVQGHIGEKVGVVKVLGGKYFVESMEKPRLGDAFKILREGKEVGGAIFEKSDNRGFVISSKVRLKNGDSVFITTDTAVNERVIGKEKKGKLSLRLYFTQGEKPIAEVDGVTIVGDGVLQSAQNRPLTKDEIKICFTKTDGLPVDIIFDEIVINGDIFIPKSELNAFRRKVYAEYIEETIVGINKRYSYEPISKKIGGKNDKTALISADFDGVAGVDKDLVGVYKYDDYRAEIPKNFLQGNFEKFIYYPAFCTSQDEDVIRKAVQDYGLGIYAESYAGVKLATERNVPLFIGTGLNVTNAVALSTWMEQGAKYVALSKELNENETKALASERVFVLSTGNIKIMDLCYCPFGKTCTKCDKKQIYLLTDESGREFPVRRYVSANGDCRFEVYNCANLVSKGVVGAGKLIDVSVLEDKGVCVAAKDSEEEQKFLYKTYTSGHSKRGVL